MKIYLALFVCLMIVNTGSVMLDSRIISFTYPDGTVWENPNAHNSVQNINCPDTVSKMNKLCDAFCSKQMLRDITDARYSHYNALTHYQPLMYNYTSSFKGLNASAMFQKAQAWEERWIKVYDTQLAACKLCAER